MAIDYTSRIPNNVDLSDNRTLQRALEHWQPAFLDWWKDLGPTTYQDHDVYLRTATSVDAKGARMATADSESIAIWDIAGRKTISRINTPKGQATFTLVMAADGSKVASIARDSVVRLHNAQTGELIKSLAFPGPGAADRPAPRAIAFSPDGKTLAIGTAEGWICLAGTE